MKASLFTFHAGRKRYETVRAHYATPTFLKTQSSTSSTRRIFVGLFFFAVFCGWTIHPTAKMYEEVNRKLPARNTTVQLLTFFTDPECHNVTDGQTDRQTDRRHYDDCVYDRSKVACPLTRQSQKVELSPTIQYALFFHCIAVFELQKSSRYSPFLPRFTTYRYC